MRISDWSSDVCSSDLPAFGEAEVVEIGVDARPAFPDNLPRAWREGDTVFVNGLYRHGFLLAPAMARRAADLALGATASMEEGDANRIERQVSLRGRGADRPRDGGSGRPRHQGGDGGEREVRGPAAAR